MTEQVISIKLTADGAGFSSALREARSDMKSLGESAAGAAFQIQLSSKATNTNGEALQAANQAAAIASAQFANLSAQIATLVTTAGAISDAIQGIANVMQQASAANQQASASIGSVSEAAKGLSPAMESVKTITTDVGKEMAKTAAKGLFTTVAMRGVAAGAAGAAAGMAGAAAGGAAAAGGLAAAGLAGTVLTGGIGALAAGVVGVLIPAVFDLIFAEDEQAVKMIGAANAAYAQAGALEQLATSASRALLSVQALSKMDSAARLGDMNNQLGNLNSAMTETGKLKVQYERLSESLSTPNLIPEGISAGYYTALGVLEQRLLSSVKTLDAQTKKTRSATSLYKSTVINELDIGTDAGSTPRGQVQAKYNPQYDALVLEAQKGNLSPGERAAYITERTRLNTARERDFAALNPGFKAQIPRAVPRGGTQILQQGFSLALPTKPAQSLADALKEVHAEAEKLLAPLSKIPDDIVKTDEATEKLAQKFAKVQEIVAKGKFGKDEAAAAKTEIEQLREALAGVAEIKKLPFTQAMEDLQRQVETGKLLIAGKKEEVDAEEKIRSLMKAVGAERRDQLALVLRARGITSDEVRDYFEQLGVLRQQTAELKKQEDAQAKLTKARDELKANLRQGVKDLFDGKGLDAIKGVFNRMFERVQEQLTDQLTNQIFGKLFQEQQPDLPGVTAINTAGEQIAQELAAVSTQTTNVKTGLENLVIGLGNAAAALDKIATGPAVPTKDKLLDGQVPIDSKTPAELQLPSPNDKLPDGQVPIYGRTSTELQLPRSNDKIPAPSLPHIKTLSEKLASGVQTALQGAAKGQAASGVLKSFGIQQSKLGSQIGGAIGNAILPGIGGFIGGAIGGTIGGLFKKPKTGSSAVISQDGSYAAGSAVGNSAAFKDQAKGLAGNVVSGLEGIAEQLGGIATGKISVSLGVRKDKPVVDTTGKNRTKGAGVTTFGKGEESAAVAFAIADALGDGAIAGLSEKVKAALTSSTDIERALREAVKVDQIEQILAGFGGAAKKSFVDFERQAKERLRIAGKYGFDLVKLEAENTKQRKALLDQSIESVTGGLKKLLDDLISGEKAPGTLLDRREALVAKKVELEKTAPTDAADAQKLAEVLDQLYQVSLEAFGTAGAQFAADRSGIKSSAEAVIDQATRDLTAAQETARKNAGTDQATTDALLAQSNGHLSGINTGMDEANDKLAQIERGIAQLGNSFLGNTGGGSGVNFRELADIGRIAR